MNRKMQLNLALLGVAVVLGIVAVWLPGKDKDKPAHVADLDASKIDHIEIKGRQNLVLDKREGHWLVVQPFQAPANDNRVAMLLKIPESTSGARYPAKAEELSKFQLAPPNATLVLGNTTLDFGGSDPIQQQRYVKVGDTVHLVEDNFYHHLTAPPTDYVEKKLLPDNADPQRIELPGIALAKDKDGKWNAQPPRSDNPPLQETVEAWKNARAYDVQLYKPEKSGKGVKETAAVTLADGKTVEFIIVQRQPDAVLARPDWGLQFQVVESVSKQLLGLSAPPKPEAAKPVQTAVPSRAKPRANDTKTSASSKGKAKPKN